MTTFDDTDEVTGLPPLGEPAREDGMILTSYALSDGIVAHPQGDEPVVFLSVRGLVQDQRAQSGVGWAQFHIGIPRDKVGDIVVGLAMLTSEGD